MEIKLVFDDDVADFIASALEAFLNAMDEEVLDRRKLLEVVIACSLSLAYEYLRNPEQTDIMVEDIRGRVKQGLENREELLKMDENSSEGEKKIH